MRELIKIFTVVTRKPQRNMNDKTEQAVNANELIPIYCSSTCALAAPRPEFSVGFYGFYHPFES